MTSTKVAFNGWHRQRSSVQSGVFQGSPLSPLLFVLAVQPMSAHARQQLGLHGLSLPNGQPSHHSCTFSADATGARLQRSKSSSFFLEDKNRVAGGLEYRWWEATACSMLRRFPPIPAWWIHAWCHAWLASGGRAL